MSKLTFYLKSGNIFEINGVTDWNVKTNGNGITEISLTQKPRFFGKTYKLIVKSLRLDSIEAIVEEL